MTARKAEAEEQSPARPRRTWSTKLAHPSYVIEPCPNPDCGFPEADGGYCEECGWTLPTVTRDGITLWPK